LFTDPHPQKDIPMKAIWNGAVIAQSDDTVVVEGNHYFPESSLNRDYITFSNHHTMCSWKGQASYYSLLVNGEMNTDAAWYYPDPKPEAENIKGHIAFWKGASVRRFMEEGGFTPCSLAFIRQAPDVICMLIKDARAGRC
jgi:uncharacterized protein (DUF427 family)